jgi:hypothetical protein
MNVTQENFERAVSKAGDTLRKLVLEGYGTLPDLGQESEDTLQSWLWDLEAVAAGIRSELATRGDQPVDFG